MYNTIDWPTCFWAYEIRGFNFSRRQRLICINGSQLAEMKKSIPDMFLP